MKYSLISILISLAAFCGCAQSSSKDARKASAPEAKVYRTLKVHASDAEVTTEYSASLEGLQLVEIRPQVSGIITSIRISEGAAVKRGQTLFIIDQVPYQAALNVASANLSTAKAQLETAQLNADSCQKLFEKKVISEHELQTALNTLATAKASVAQADAQYTSAANNLSYTVVKSPVDGRAGMIPYKVGALVSSSISQPLVTVSDDSSIHAYFSLSELDLLEKMQIYGSRQDFVEKAPEVSLKLIDGSIYPHKGKIDAVSGIADQATGSVRVRATFPNAEGLISSGFTGIVTLSMTRPDSFVIPSAATYQIQDRVFVYKVKDGKAVSSQVKVFPVLDGLSCIVESGLEEGDIIISSGAGLVKEGTAVRMEE